MALPGGFHEWQAMMGTRLSLRPLWEAILSTRPILHERTVPEATTVALSQAITFDLVERVPRQLMSALFDECGARAYSLATLLLDGDRQRAEDVVCTVFVEVSRALPGFDNPDIVDLSGFTLRCVRHRCLDLLRSPGEASTWSPNRAPEPSEWATTALTPDQVREALAPLSCEQPSAVKLASVEGRTAAEIASVTGGTAPDVNRLRLGLRRFAASMSPDVAEEMS